MAHVIHSLNITISGSCHHADAVADEEHHRYAHELLEGARAVLLGRHTFDLLESFWPAAEYKEDLPPAGTRLAAALNAIPKYVLSSRMVDTGWNTKWVRGPELDELRRVLREESGTVVVFGSPGLGTSLMSAGLVNEVHVVAQPFIGVVGSWAFKGLQTRQRLALIEARPFRSGVVLLRYRTDARAT